ncbi:MAG: CBS domain-containing protein [Akkermansiaceae bacterium]|nr:CBS domain-containing protein [Verrucomicrobiales bacterium]
MIVSMWMTRNVLTIEPHMTITEVAALMASKRVRRLPVVEIQGDQHRLIGIVSAKDILHAFPSDVNPFAVAAADSRVAPGTAADIMSRYLHTTTPDSPIEQAAALMTEKKIGALPVVRDGKLIGMITESDVFRAFVSFFPALEGGARITFDLSDDEDIFTFISHEAQRRKLRVLTLITSHQDTLPVCVVRITGAGTERFLEDLWTSGHRVLNVIRFSTPDQPPRD